MNKETIKKTLAGIGIAGLITSVSIMSIGCGSSNKKEAPADEAQMEGQASCGAGADSTAACGAAADSTASCGAAADSTASCGG